MSANLKQILSKPRLFRTSTATKTTAKTNPVFPISRQLASLSSYFDLAGKPKMFNPVGNGSGVLGNRMSSLSTNYALKYKDKLLKKAREEGYESIEAMQAAYSEKKNKEQQVKQVKQAKQAKQEAELSNQATAKPDTNLPEGASVLQDSGKSKVEAQLSAEDYFSDEESQEPSGSGSASNVSTTKYSSSNNLPKNVKSLDQIMKLELLEGLPKEEIGKIWTNYHVGKKCLSAVIPSDSYTELTSNSREHPTFILPLPRLTGTEGGVEFFLVQSQFHQIFFTSLAEFQMNKEMAKPYLILTHFTDFFESHGVVLMKGEILETSGEASFGLDEAKILALILQLFYVAPTKERKELMSTFTKNPSQFDYNKLIEFTSTLD